VFDNQALKQLKNSIKLNSKFKTPMLDIIENDLYKLHFIEKVSIYKIVEELQKELDTRIVYENVRAWFSKKKKEWRKKIIYDNMVILTISNKPLSLLYELDNSIVVNLNDNLLESKCRDIINWNEFKNTEEAQKLNIFNIESLIKLLKEVGYKYVLLQTSNKGNLTADIIITDKKIDNYNLLVDFIPNIELLFEIDKVKYPVTALKIKKDIKELNNRIKEIL